MEGLRCYWCERPGGTTINDIVFCWQSQVCYLELCANVLAKIDTKSNDVECPVCLNYATVLELPNCKHKLCLDCYKTIYFGKSEYEKPCDCSLPTWTFDECDEDGESDGEKEHSKFLQRINYAYENDERTYEELIELRNSLLYERPEWMNCVGIVNYENELFQTCSEYKIKENTYLSNLTIGNKICPLCRL